MIGVETAQVQSVSGPRRLLWLLPLVALFLVLTTWANYHYLETPKYAHRDFMSLWGGGKAILEGLDPYDPAVWRPLRLELGSKWLTGDRGNPFPLWTLILMLPLSMLSLGWAAAIWLTASQTLLALSLYLLAVELGGRRPSVAEFGLVALGAFQFRGTLVTLHNGQITLILLAALTLFLFLLKREHPFLAGAVLALILLKPNPFILFAPLVGAWLLLSRQWRVIAGGTATVSVFLVASWLLRPGWLFTWQTVRDKTATSIRSFIMPTLWGVATEISVDWAPLLGTLLVTLLVALLGWYVLTRRGLDATHVVSLALAGSLLTTPYAWAYEHALLLIPLVLVFTHIKQRWLASFAWVGVVFLLPWVLYRASEIRGRGTIEVIVPLLTLVVAWFYVRWRRTGTDHIVEVAPG